MGTSAAELVEKGLFAEAAQRLDELSCLPPDLAALRAKLESHIGDPQRALNAAQHLLKQKLNIRDRTLCWETVGRIQLSLGRISDGLRAMRNAFDASAALEDGRLEARLIASYTESLLHCRGLEPAALEMSRLRRAAMRAGDGFSLVEFHYLNAEICARRGLLTAASSSIDTARALLEKFPHAGQQGRLAVVASGLAAAQSDYEGAVVNATEALDYASRSGLRIVRLPALNNIVYVRLAQRRFDEARQYLRELLGISHQGNSTEIAYRDTEMMLALASDDLELASQVAAQIAELTSTQENRDPYYELWYLPNQIRWLYRVGKIEDGVQRALAALAQNVGNRDRDPLLIARLQLLTADGLARANQLDEAVSHLITALQSTTDSGLALAIEGLRVGARIEAASNTATASQCYGLASDLLGDVGNMSAQREVQRDAADARVETLNAGKGFAHLAPSATAISMFLELGAHIPTLAKETVAMIATSNAALHVALSATDENGDSTPISDHRATDCPTLLEHQHDFRIRLGTHRKQYFEIVATPRPNSSARMTLFQIGQIVKAAMTIAVAHHREREQATWSNPTPEQQLGLIYSSERMAALVKTIRNVASSNVTVLLTGETGVGKELFARALHLASPRSEKVFLPFNCGTVPRDLIDSQLFGHRRGSFTGAHADAIGVIRSAAGGTLFLDEIGEMAIETQPKLLRFLEAGEILPLGETKPQTVDVRIVAATNANLDQMVADGRFREDLYYRLNVIRINIPPLRERREEIPALVEHFLDRFARELQKPMMRIADETLEYLVLYRWPGNVRQLANELRRMAALSEPGAVLMPAHLSDDIVASRRTVPVGQAPRGFSEVVTRIDQPLSAAVEHIERAAIQRALAMTDGNLVEAARMLGLSRKGLYLKRHRLKLD